MFSISLWGVLLCFQVYITLPCKIFWINLGISDVVNYTGSLVSNSIYISTVWRCNFNRTNETFFKYPIIKCGIDISQLIINLPISNWYGAIIGCPYLWYLYYSLPWNHWLSFPRIRSFSYFPLCPQCGICCILCIFSKKDNWHISLFPQGGCPCHKSHGCPHGIESKFKKCPLIPNMYLYGS